MRDKDLYARILGIEEPWFVREVDLQLQAGEVSVYLEFLKDSDSNILEKDDARRRLEKLESQS